MENFNQYSMDIMTLLFISGFVISILGVMIKNPRIQKILDISIIAVFVIIFITLLLTINKLI